MLSGQLINQFQLTQPIIAGKRFFQYTLHYLDLYEKIEKRVIYRFNEKKGEIVKSGSGDNYVYNMFINVLMFFVDKFSMESLTDARLFFLYKWAFSLRVCMKAVYRESVNKYARGLSDRINYGLNIFSLISEMRDPIELDTIILENISEEKFEKSKINTRRYQEMYKLMFGKESK